MALKSKAKGFVYKPRTVDQIKERATRKSGRYDSIFKQGFDTWRAKTGDNLIRYLPPSWDDADHYGYTIFVHNGIGPDNATYLCPRKMLNKPCPICEAEKEAKDAGENEEASALKVSERIVSWILDRDADDPEKPMLYGNSWTQDRDIVSLCVNERTGEILMIDHPDKGFDVSFKRQGAGLKTRYYGYAIARDDSPIHDSEKAQDEILEFVKDNPVPDTLNFYDYDYMKGVLSGNVAQKDEVLDRDVDEDEEPKAKTKPKQRVVEPEEDEDDTPEPSARHRGPRRDQELDEEDEPAPRTAKPKPRIVEEEDDETPPPRAARRKPEPADEEVDEEAEELPRSRQTASAPRSNGRSRVIEEDEEEDAAPPTRASSRSTTRTR